MGTSDYRFVFSTAVNAATEKFDNILESGGGNKGLTSALRLSLNEHPDHMDALYHYSMCKLDEGKSLDAFAFAHAAVAIGRAALPSGFRFENDCLPGGWIENRPFLRSLFGLMSTQRVMGRVAEPFKRLASCWDAILRIEWAHACFFRSFFCSRTATTRPWRFSRILLSKALLALPPICMHWH